MKKNYSLLFILFCSAILWAQTTSIYDAYIIVKTDGVNNTYINLESFKGASLGTFSDTKPLIVAGGQNKISKCNGGNVTSGILNYRFYEVSAFPGGAFKKLPMNWVSDDSSTNGCGSGNQTWEGTSGTVNVAAGLPTGTYILEVYTDAPGSPTTAYYSNFANNFKAYFDVDNTILSVEGVNGVKNKSKVVDGKLFTSKKGNLKLQVYDFSGKLVKTMNFISNGNPLDVSLAKKGNYIITIDSGAEKEIVKFSY